MNALSHRTDRPSRLAIGWFVATTAVLCVAGLLDAVLLWVVGPPGRQTLPAAFLVSTVLLGAVSSSLAKAEDCARREKQPALRLALTTALTAAILFLAVQGTALSGLLRTASPAETIGPAAFVFVLATLHALHVTAAMLWLVHVTLRGFAGGYDHEYRFGLTACMWCWHALGMVWIAILLAFLVAV